MINIIVNYWREIIMFMLVITTVFYFSEHLQQTKEYNLLVQEYNELQNKTSLEVEVGKAGNSYYTNGEEINPATPFNFTINYSGVID